MNQCRKYGLDVTKRCNWRCTHCYYRFADDFNAKVDKSMTQVIHELFLAKQRGCDHVCLVGWGEPMLYPWVEDVLRYCNDTDMTTSIITNGTASIDRYGRLYDLGLDHLHISMHGVDEILDSVSEVPNASRMQRRTLEWLADTGLPFRTNVTLQKKNFDRLEQIIDKAIGYGSRHCVLLEFLPHYHWNDPEKMRTVAVHPNNLRPHVERCLDLLENAGVMATLRYHPFCHIDPKYWKYIVNARYVLYDPWEWEYGHCGEYDDVFWKSAVGLGEVTGIKGEPCSNCAVYEHCGGWNRITASGFDGADLKAIPEELVRAMFPDSIGCPGYFHDLNRANGASGVLRSDVEVAA